MGTNSPRIQLAGMPLWRSKCRSVRRAMSRWVALNCMVWGDAEGSIGRLCRPCYDPVQKNSNMRTTSCGPSVLVGAV